MKPDFGKRGKKSPKRAKQALTTGPLFGKGKKKTAGHDMGAMFAAHGPKKPEADLPPRTRKADRSARMSRLKNKFI